VEKGEVPWDSISDVQVKDLNTFHVITVIVLFVIMSQRAFTDLCSQIERGLCQTWMGMRCCGRKR
jgi:hypothetical protein